MVSITATFGMEKFRHQFKYDALNQTVYDFRIIICNKTNVFF